MKLSLVKPDHVRLFPCCVCGEAREVGAHETLHVIAGDDPRRARRDNCVMMADVRGKRGPERVAGGFIGEDKGASHGEGLNGPETIALPGFPRLSRVGTLSVFVDDACPLSTTKGPPDAGRPFRLSKIAGLRPCRRTRP